MKIWQLLAKKRYWPFLHFVHATFQAFSNILMYHSRLDLIGFGHMSVRKKMKIFWWFKGIERNQLVARNGLKSYFKNSPSRSTIHFSRISYTAWKCPDSGKYFPAFGLNTDRYVVSLRIQSECGKILTGKTPNKDTLHFMKWSSD